LKGQQLDTLVGGWAEKDPAAAMAYAQKLSKEEGSEMFTQEIIGRWAQKDMKAAQDWIDGLTMTQRKLLKI
jgi:hypothetical protein